MLWKDELGAKMRKTWCRSVTSVWENLPDRTRISLKRCPGGSNNAFVSMVDIQDADGPKTIRSIFVFTWTYSSDSSGRSHEIKQACALADAQNSRFHCSHREGRGTLSWLLAITNTQCDLGSEAPKVKVLRASQLWSFRGCNSISFALGSATKYWCSHRALISNVRGDGAEENCHARVGVSPAEGCWKVV